MIFFTMAMLIVAGDTFSNFLLQTSSRYSVNSTFLSLMYCSVCFLIFSVQGKFRAYFSVQTVLWLLSL